MYFIGSTPNGYVLMPTIEQQSNYLSFTSYPPTPASFINPSTYPPLNFAPQALQNTLSNPSLTLNTPPLIQPTIESVNTLYSTTTTTSTTNQTSYNHYSRNKPNIYQPKSRRSGHVSKSHRVNLNINTKHTAAIQQTNFQKSCPSCCKLWRDCKCSNIKNRPDPKPYCKFVPPRMLRKLVAIANNHKNISNNTNNHEN